MLPIQKKTKLAWMARLHFWVTFFSFFLYLGLGFTLGPDFFYSDIKQKLFAFGDDTIAITAVVPPPPSSPVVTATPSCVAGAPRIALDWANDPGADFWDIDRDSAPLTTGVTVSQYVDTAVVPNGTYTYVVTAYGSMGPGSAVSNPVVVTALDCPNLLPPATVRIETLGDKNVSEARQNVDLSRRRPKVTGTTNVANAIIDIVVTNPTIRARTTANTNGYFEWIPPMKLDTGNHLLEVKATDPNDATRTATDSFVFWTKNVSAGTTDGKRTQIRSAREMPDIDLYVRVDNPGKELFQEETLSVTAGIAGDVFPEDAELGLFVNDASRQDVLRLPADPVLDGKESITVEKTIPLYLQPGEFRVRADLESGGVVTSREAVFTLKGLPFLTIGGREITYTEAASLIGLVFLISLFLFLFFLLLFIREYWLYLHSLRAITERHLRALGFIGTRKGVMR